MHCRRDCRPPFAGQLALLLLAGAIVGCADAAAEAASDGSTTANSTPIIGILTQEVSKLIKREYQDNNFTSYIAASYVKFIEGAGGRVVPLWIGQSRDYYADIMTKINGVLLPGGATYFNQTGGYAEAGSYIYEIAVEMNRNGSYMPVWGTCLGFELLVYLSANSTELRTDCSSSAQALPLEFKSDFQESRLFANASSELIENFQKYPVTANFHIFCFTEETFNEHKMHDLWKVLSVNQDWNGIEFISSIEHKVYPFYGVQFHPEKNLYEFVANRNITHSAVATQTSQYFADFFVSETRKNTNRFGNTTEESTTLIYNYKPEYTGRVGSAFLQQYLFEDARSGARSSDRLAMLLLVLKAIGLGALLPLWLKL